MLQFEPPELVEGPSRPPIFAQKILLHDWHASLTNGATPPTPPLGRLVVFKDGLGTMRPDLRPSHVFIVWRTLDLFSWFDRKFVKRFVEAGVSGSTVPDVIIAGVHPAGCICDVQPAALAELRFVEPEGDSL